MQTTKLTKQRCKALKLAYLNRKPTYNKYSLYQFLGNHPLVSEPNYRLQTHFEGVSCSNWPTLPEQKLNITNWHRWLSYYEQLEAASGLRYHSIGYCEQWCWFESVQNFYTDNLTFRKSLQYYKPKTELNLYEKYEVARELIFAYRKLITFYTNCGNMDNHFAERGSHNDEDIQAGPPPCHPFYMS